MHIGNLFIDGARVGFLDWGVGNVNTPIRDVSYLLTMAMAMAMANHDRRRTVRDFLRFCLVLRKASAATNITSD